MPRSSGAIGIVEGAGMSVIAAIETVYKGVKFRSRIEARWAVFFDELGIRWDYEIEGFQWEEDGKIVRYLPDFWLPDQQMWVEVKGRYPSDNELRKAYSLCAHTQKRVAVMYGGLKPLVSVINGYENVSVSGSFGHCFVPRGPTTPFGVYMEELRECNLGLDVYAWGLHQDTGRPVYDLYYLIDEERNDMYIFHGDTLEPLSAGAPFQISVAEYDSVRLARAYIAAQTKRFEFSEQEKW